MPSDKALSFTATLHLDARPVLVLGEWTNGPVIAAESVPPVALHVDNALGTLPLNDQEHAHDAELGLASFTLRDNREPVLLYFRHSEGGYRLYVRRGAHSGRGVFLLPNGVLSVQAIAEQDPHRWQVPGFEGAETLQPGDNLSLHLQVPGSGEGVALHGIGLSSGYLRTTAKRASNLSLSVVQAQVDWLSAG